MTPFIVRSDPIPSLGIECPVRIIKPARRYSQLVLQPPCSLCECKMSKRVLSRASSLASSHSSVEHVRKRRREGEANQPTPRFNPNYTATAEDAARVDADPPLQKLLKAASGSLKTVEGTEAVVHWMRMADLRSKCYETLLSNSPTPNLGLQLLIIVRFRKPRNERERSTFP